MARGCTAMPWATSRSARDLRMALLRWSARSSASASEMGLLSQSDEGSFEIGESAAMIVTTPANKAASTETGRLVGAFLIKTVIGHGSEQEPPAFAILLSPDPFPLCASASLR